MREAGDEREPTPGKLERKTSPGIARLVGQQPQPRIALSPQQMNYFHACDRGLIALAFTVESSRRQTASTARVRLASSSPSAK